MELVFVLVFRYLSVIYVIDVEDVLRFIQFIKLGRNKGFRVFIFDLIVCFYLFLVLQKYFRMVIQIEFFWKGSIKWLISFVE